MKLYHIAIEQEKDWYIGRVLERPGITTQGQTLDELVFMMRDAIRELWDEVDVSLELMVSPAMKVAGRKRHPARAMA
jgi:predicted RNase H-like HicB family nuclease